MPNTYVVAATGVLTAATESPGGTRTFTYRAEDVHDFAWMADPYMQIMTGLAQASTTAPSRCASRLLPPRAGGVRDAATSRPRSARSRSSATYFVPYPWPIMSIIDPPVDAAAGAGGMEYPTLVTTAGDSVFLRPGVRLPEYVTVHEVGHNWFQGMLASNEAQEAWIDEGVNEWADAHVMADLYGARTSGVDWLGFQAEIVALRDALSADPSSLPQPIASAAYAFVDPKAYATATYDYTMRALLTLEHEVGSTRFLAAMKVYTQKFAFKHPTGRDFYATLSEQLGQDLGWFFHPAFQEVGGMRLSIRSSACREAHGVRGVVSDGTNQKTVTETEAPDTGTWVCEVVVQNTGVVHVPVDIELRFADDSTQRLHWDDKGAGTWQRFSVEHSTRLASVKLDPDGKLALESPLTLDYRLDGDGAASLRAGARIASWTQTLMQLVGP